MKARNFFDNISFPFFMDLLRIPVETNSNSGLQGNSDSGNIRTPIPVYPNATIGSRWHYLLNNISL